MDEKPELLEMTADIVSAYVGNNTVTAEALPALIANIHAALSGVSNGPVEVPPEPKEPAVPIRKSINADFLICLEDGRKFKSLKRHLRTKYDMSPEDYRAKWGLPKDYPMVARTTPRPVRNWPSRWAWARAAASRPASPAPRNKPGPYW